MPRNPLDTDPSVIAARQLAAHRAELAEQLAARLTQLASRADLANFGPVGTAAVANHRDDLVELTGELARITRVVRRARDIAVELARTLPESDRPSWADLADAMGEPDRNNLARRYRNRKATTDE